MQCVCVACAQLCWCRNAPQWHKEFVGCCLRNVATGVRQAFVCCLQHGANSPGLRGFPEHPTVGPKSGLQIKPWTQGVGVPRQTVPRVTCVFSMAAMQRPCLWQQVWPCIACSSRPCCRLPIWRPTAMPTKQPAMPVTTACLSTCKQAALKDASRPARLTIYKTLNNADSGRAHLFKVTAQLEDSSTAAFCNVAAVPIASSCCCCCSVRLSLTACCWLLGGQHSSTAAPC